MQIIHNRSRESKAKEIMKKLSVIMFFVSVIIYGCTEKRVFTKDLKIKSGFMYYEGKPFTGVVFEMHKYDKSQLLGYEGFVGGIKNGEIKAYHLNGQLSLEGAHKLGKKDGEWMFYYENGEPKSEITYKEGKMDGMFRSYYLNGEPHQEVVFKNGEYDGVFRIYYLNGELELEGAYKDGKKKGVFRRYYGNGELKAEQSY
jgi:antitoxin component YwqK of YwqJK toxin-antitoxin module